jgi:hypothetical protein
MALEGRYLWDLKDWIDRKWMFNYTTGLPDMEDMMGDLTPPVTKAAKVRNLRPGNGSRASPLGEQAAGERALAMLKEVPMRCGGCGAKVRVLLADGVSSR